MKKPEREDDGRMIQGGKRKNKTLEADSNSRPWTVRTSMLSHRGIYSKH